MSRKSGCTVTIIGVIVLLIALILIGGNRGKKKNQKTEIYPISVVTAEVMTGPIQESLEFTGTLEGREQAAVVSQTAGVVKKVLFTLGQSCRAGQVLVEVENRQQQAAVDQAEAQLLAAQTNYEKAQNDLARVQRLFDEKVTTKDNLELAQLNLKSSFAALKGAQAALEVARKQLADTRIEATISGRVGNRSVNLGQTVVPGTEIATLVDDSEFILKVLVPEANIGKISAGQSVEVRIDAVGGKSITGRVRSVGVAFEKDGSSYPVEVVVPRNGDPDLKSGMFGRCVFATASKENAQLIPTNAIVTLNDQSYVYIAKDNRAVIQQVEIGLRNSRFTEVLGGLEPGVKVITIGKDQVTDGALIQ